MTLRARKTEGGSGNATAMDSGAATPPDADRAAADRKRSPTPASTQVFVWGFVGMVVLAMAVHHIQSVWLPRPLSAEEAGRTGFSEERAMEHLKVLTRIGPKPVGSENLEHALEYIVRALELIKSKANPRVIMEIEKFHSVSGINRLRGGLFTGKTLAYADLNHVLVRLSSKHSEDAEDNAILVSSHVDTVVTSNGAGDCGSCVSAMLELVRAMSNIAQELTHSIVFLFNTGEEEGLDGAHSFITQHHWNSSTRAFIDLEAMGAGGKSRLFQAGPDQWLIDVFARTAKHPSANIVSQDVFQAGLIKSATDFQVYREISGLSGLDFSSIENCAVYHTQNDALKLVRSGSLQHLGDNILPFLTEVGSSPDLARLGRNHSTKLEVVYFDILGKYMITFTQDSAKFIYTSFLMQSLLLFAGSMIRADRFSLPALLLASIGVILSWILSVSSAVAIAAVLPRIWSSAIPYLANPVLTIGLFGAPAMIGGVVGHGLGHKLLLGYLIRSMPSRTDAAAEAEKVMFKSVFLIWLAVFGLGFRYNAGSSYIAMAWLVVPSIAYGVFESSLSRRQPSRQLSFWTLLFGLPVPIVLTADVFLSLPNVLISDLVRFDRNPGAGSPFLANAVIAVMVSAIVCLSISYLLPYIHRGTTTALTLLAAALVLIVSLSVVSYELLPAFTNDVAKGTYVVHAIEANINKSSSNSYVSVSFTTPGGLGQKEIEVFANGGFKCGSVDRPDFVTFSVSKGCEKVADLTDELWQGRPTLTTISDHTVGDQRITSLLLKTMSSNRWSLSIDTDRIQALQLDIITETGTKTALAPKDDISGIDGIHVVQFASGRNGPREFGIDLVWRNGISADPSRELIKLRTDLNVLTPDAAAGLKLLPDSCVLFAAKSPLVPALFTFGDSMVDVGTNYFVPNTSILANYPPFGETYFHRPNGRFSNGLLSSDFLAFLLNLPLIPPYLDRRANHTQGANFASGGAGLLDITNSDKKIILYSEQIRQFSDLVSDWKNKQPAAEVDEKISKSIIHINVGSNDMISTYPQLEHPIPAEKYIDYLIESYERSIKELYQSGARKFAITELGPMGCTPQARMFVETVEKGQGCSDPLNDMAKGFNYKLNEMLIRLREGLPGSKIISAKAFDIYMDMINDGGKYKFVETEKNCCGAGRFNAEVPCGAAVPPEKPFKAFLCEDPSKYLFWDLHPTQQAYSYFSWAFWKGDISAVAPFNLEKLVTL